MTWNGILKIFGKPGSFSSEGRPASRPTWPPQRETQAEGGYLPVGFGKNRTIGQHEIGGGGKLDLIIADQGDGIPVCSS